MTIRKKTLIFFTLVFVSLVIITSLILDLIITTQFGTLEHEVATDMNRRHKQMLDFNLEALHPTIDDWAIWDEMFNYAENKNAAFEESNFGVSTLQSLRIQALYVYNNDNDLLYGSSLNDAGTEEVFNSQQYDELARLLLPLGDFDQEHKFVSGYISKDEDVYFAIAHGIYRTDATGSNNGTFIILKKVSIEAPKEDAFLSTVETPVFLYNLDLTENKEKFSKILKGLEEEPNISITENATELKTYSMIKDLFGDPVLLVESIYTRDISQKGQEIKNYAIIAMAVIGFATGLVSYLNFDNELIKGITILTSFMESVLKNPGTKERLALHSNKEMSTVSDTLNSMLDKLSEQQKQLELTNQNLATINKQIADKQQELSKSNQELQELNQAMIGREMKMVELKKEVELLRTKVGQTPLPPSQ